VHKIYSINETFMAICNKLWQPTLMKFKLYKVLFKFEFVWSSETSNFLFDDFFFLCSLLEF